MKPAESIALAKAQLTEPQPKWMTKIADTHFYGETYNPELDKSRLSGQILRVYHVMRDAGWRTLAEIELVTMDPQASISARLRDLRKERFGSYTVERRRRGAGHAGTFEYRLIVSQEEWDAMFNTGKVTYRTGE